MKYKENYINLFKKIFIVVFLIINIFLIYLFSNPNQRIKSTDFSTAIIYLNLFDKTLNNEYKDKFYKNLISENNDIKSLNSVSHFALKNNKCNLINMLDDKCNQLKSLNKDSVWTIKLSDRYHRESSTEMIYMENGICEHVKKLKKQCINNK